MSTFDKAIPLILKHEGGYVNNPNDKGGPTNKGITLATFRRYVRPGGTIADLKALTEDQAVIVYKRQYWDKVVADALPPGVGYAVADFAVNSGPSRAARYLQRVVGVTQDGKIGPQTIAAVNRMPARDVINRLCDARLAFMRGIRKGKDWVHFGKGWTRRVEDVRSQALKWAGSADMRPPQPDMGQMADDTPRKPAKGLWGLLSSLWRKS